jgi:hypothetical protein
MISVFRTVISSSNLHPYHIRATGALHGSDTISSSSTGVPLICTTFLSEYFKTWSHILSSWDLFPSAPNFEETPMVAIKQGGTAEAAISGVIKTIDSMISTVLFLVID